MSEWFFNWISAPNPKPHSMTYVIPWGKNVAPYFIFLDILKLDNIFKLKIGSLVHKLQYNKHETPPALHDLVSLASDVHKHNTRIATGQNFCLRSKRSRTSRTKYRDARRSFRIRDSRKMGREQKYRRKASVIKCLKGKSYFMENPWTLWGFY